MAPHHLNSSEEYVIEAETENENETETGMDDEVVLQEVAEPVDCGGILAVEGPDDTAAVAVEVAGNGNGTEGALG